MMRELCALVAGSTDVCLQDRVPELLALARTHRVHLIVAQRLGRDAPEELRNEARVEAVRDTVRVRELVRVVSALEADGCAPVVFKGAALGLTHYQDSWLRPRLDADVLVDPACRARAAATLAALGYERPSMTSGRYVMHQEMYVRPDPVVGEHVVDLHWKLVNPNVLAALPAHAELRARAAAVAAPGGRVHAASPADALVIACVHLAAHHAGSEQLLWLHDIHAVATRLTAEEWSTAVRLACQARVAAIVRHGLELAARAFGPVAPPSALQTLSAPAHEPSALLLRPRLRPVDRLRADVAALGASGGARLIAEHLFPPASYMREKYGLRSGALLPWAYAKRIAGGASGFFRRDSIGVGAAASRTPATSDPPS